MTKFKKSLAALMAVVSTASALCVPMGAFAMEKVYDNAVADCEVVELSYPAYAYASTTTKDISSGFTWVSQGSKDWCWAVVGSHVLSYAFGDVSVEDVVKSKYGDLINGNGSAADVQNYFNILQAEKKTSHTWSNISGGKKTALTRIKACISNGKPVGMRITYTGKDNTTKKHFVLCVGYETTSSGTKLKIYDSAPSDSSSGVYWTGVFDSTKETFNTSLYGSCTFGSGYFITKN